MTERYEEVSQPGRGRLYAAIAVAVLAVLAGGWYFTRKGGPQAPAGSASASAEAGAPKDGNPLPLVSVVVPTLGEVAGAVAVTGQIAALNDMPIGVDGAAVRISEVLVEPGDHVRRGQVLARLNPITAQSQLDTAAATLDELRATAAVAQAEWARAQRAPDAFSVEESERRRVAAVTAQARVKSSEAQLEGARDQFSRTTVVAPTDGIVLTRTAEIGQIAVPGSSVLFHLARNGAIEMRAQVAEQDMPRLKVGQSVSVRLDGLTKAFTGKVWQLGAVIDPATRQGSVRIALPGNEQILRPGAYARADIATGSSMGVLLPQTAVLSDPAGTYVLVVGEGDKVERRDVRIAGARDAGMLVSGGLGGSERVVAVAGAFLRVGEQVTVAAPVVAATPPTGANAARGAAQAVLQ
jgi:RND family efflux transporter MFP subunit